jgi:hypothetical protein
LGLEHAGGDLLYLKQIRRVARSHRLAGSAYRFDQIPGDVAVGAPVAVQGHPS